MNCPKCYGRGRVTSKADFRQGRTKITLDEISQCPECQGSGIVSCCDTAGEGYVVTEQAMLEAKPDA